MFRIPSVLVVFAIAGCLAYSQTQPEVLTNEDIKKLTAAGVPAGAITAKIAVSEPDFDTSVDGLIALASAGVDKSVIEAMAKAKFGLSPSEPPASAGVTEASASSSSSFEGSPCKTPGIFLEQEDTLAELELASFAQGKTGGLLKLGLTYGIMSSKTVGIVVGAASPARISTASPVFLFCLEKAEGGFVAPGIRDVIDPSDILLVTVRTNPKKDQRTILLGKMNVWQGNQTGTPPDEIKDTSHEELAAGVYRVRPVDDLEAGEYAFFRPVFRTPSLGPASISSRIYAFGVE